MKTLLLVEDDTATLWLYLAGLKGLAGWQLLSAENGQQALDVLQSTDVDLLVTDLNMPVMDGYRLISIVSQRYPSIPIIVLTAMPEGALQDKAKALGALRVLSKPVRLSFLMEEIRALAAKESEGYVRGLALGSLLQLMALDGKTCTMTISSGTQVGHIYVRDGHVIHAAAGAEQGLLALYRILCWPRPEAEFVEICRVEPSIAMPLNEILINVAVIQDGGEPTQAD